MGMKKMLDFKMKWLIIEMIYQVGESVLGVLLVISMGGRTRRSMRKKCKRLAMTYAQMILRKKRNRAEESNIQLYGTYESKLFII